MGVRQVGGMGRGERGGKGGGKGQHATEKAQQVGRNAGDRVGHVARAGLVGGCALPPPPSPLLCKLGLELTRRSAQVARRTHTPPRLPSLGGGPGGLSRRALDAVGKHCPPRPAAIAVVSPSAPPSPDPAIARRLL